MESAEVILSGVTLRTGKDGIATGTAALGRVNIAVTKTGLLPASTTLMVDEARLWLVSLELQPQETVEEKITVYATRNDVRIEDSPLHVEVLQREEIEEKMMMTPGVR